MAQAATARRPKSTTAKGGTGKTAAKQPPPWSHGQFYWNELRTRDAKGAMKFYADTVGWSFEAASTPHGEPYWVAMSGGKPVAGLFQLPSPKFDDVPESWMSFLAVDDVDARVATALKAGAKLAMPIFDVPGVGRFAMLIEPSGAGVGWVTPVGPLATNGGAK